MDFEDVIISNIYRVLEYKKMRSAGKGKGGKGGKGGKVGSGKTKRNPTSRSIRSGLQFPVGRLHRFLKTRVLSSHRVGATAAVYTSAILGDEELDSLIKATIAGGGVIPHIHRSLIDKS